jgi:hypothetical protein
MDGDKTITAHFVDVPVVFLADGAFDASTTSEDLRADGSGQDWYESRNDQPGLVELNNDPIAGNLGPKALFLGSTSGNAYLSQEFGVPQTGLFAVQWEIYVDEILNLSSNPDRAGWMLIGTTIATAVNSDRTALCRFLPRRGRVLGDDGSGGPRAGRHVRELHDRRFRSDHG